MKYEDMSIQEVVIYINKELVKGRTMKEIEEVDFHVNKGVIQKRIQRKGYRKVESEFILMKKDDNTINNTRIIHGKDNNIKQTTGKLQEESRPTINNNTKILLKDETRNEEENKAFKNDEIEKLNKLLELDVNVLEKIIQEYTTKENTKISIKVMDNSTTVTSIRINKELYEKVKKKAKKEDIRLQDVFYDMMVNYLSK